MKRNMQGRMVAVLAAATVSVLALSGCGSTAPSSSEPTLSTGKVTLTVNWWGADSRTKLTQEVIDLFEKKHPNVTIKGQFSDWAGYWDKLATTTAAGNAPDVSQFDQLYLSSYAERGALLDLGTVDSYLGGTKSLATSVRDLGKVKGTQYAVPIGVSSSALLVNKALFEKYDIALPDFSTWTWSDLKKVAAEFAAKSNGAVHGLTPFGGDTFSLSYWARQHGGDLYNSKGKVAITPDILESYWNEELALVKAGATPSADGLTQSAGATLDQTDLATGKVAMGFAVAGQLSAFQAAAPDAKFVIASWPTDKSTKAGFEYLKPSMYWTISSKSKHPAEAAEFINFFTSNVAAGKITGMDRGTPANPKILKAIAGQLSTTDQASNEYIRALTPKLGDAPPITPNGASDSDAILTRYNQQVLFGQKSVADAAKGFIADLTTAITTAG